MPLSASRLQGAQEATVLAKLQELFPIPVDLKAAEKTLLEAAQADLADAISRTGEETVPEITGNAIPSVPGLGLLDSLAAPVTGTSITGTIL